jgi:protein gp37
MVNEWQDGRPPRNVWLGVSVENQAMADRRIPELLQIPAKVRFVSYEPALEAVDFHLWKSGIQHRDDFTGNPSDPTWMDQVTWVIVGGESGPQARPFNIEWARSTIAQCKEAGVACFVKQMGNDIRYGPNNTVPPEKFHDNKGGDMDEWPEDLRVREWPSTQHQVEAIP